MSDLAAVAARFSSLLRVAGVPVTPERAGRFAASLSLAEPSTVPELYWLGRVTLVSDHSFIRAFDAVFASVFEGIVDPAEFRRDAPSPPEVRREVRSSSGEARSHPRPPAGDGSSPLTSLSDGGSLTSQALSQSVLFAMSREERLRHQDFARLSPAELAELRSLDLAPPPRPSRRRARHPRGRELDVRATLRRAARTGGEPVSAVRRRRRVRSRRLVLICDISGSMEQYARAYLQLLWSGVANTKAEAFVFATRLTRLTPTLRGASPDVALERAGRKAPDWSGGTRIGEAVKSFNDGYGRRGIARGAVILILSDGWDTGEPEVLAREMERLGRLAHRIIWVNPRKADPRYTPTVRGMVAALPHVDFFVSGHSLAALEDVREAVASNRLDDVRRSRQAALG